MKVAPAYHALSSSTEFDAVLVHTGQHYDFNMSDSFIRDLALPEPDFHLGIGSGTHGEQTAGVLLKYEKICLDHRPDWVIVPGDVNSTFACALAAKKLLIPVAHLEAGLRSHDPTMPEETNRILTDRISDLLWTPSTDADQNLLHEGIPKDRIECIGNIMIDSFEMMRERIEEVNMHEKLKLPANKYALVTLHRPSNVDLCERLTDIVEQLGLIAEDVPIVFPVHPRTKKNLSKFGLWQKLAEHKNIVTVEPLGYTEFMSLVTRAMLVITDSGGLQEETTYLRIPCLTLRTSTERPVTTDSGTNQLVEPSDLAPSVDKIRQGHKKTSEVPELWDGKTATRLVKSLDRRTSSLTQ